MKPSTTAWLLPALAATFTSARDARVFVPGALSHSIPSVSPLAARLLLAERLGLSEYHNLDDVDDATISTLNQFRKSSADSLLEADRSPKRKLFLVVEGVEDIDDFLGSSESTFIVEDAPFSSDHLELIESFEDQALWSALKPSRHPQIDYFELERQYQECKNTLRPSVDPLNEQEMKILPVGDHLFGYSTALDTIHNAYGPLNVNYNSARTRLKQQIAGLLSDRGFHGLIYVLPPGPPEPKSIFKRIFARTADPLPWGVLPRQQNNGSPLGSAVSFGAGRPDINPSDKRIAETNPNPAPQPQEMQDDWTISHDQKPDFGPPPFSPARVEQAYSEAQPNRQGGRPNTQQENTSPPYGILKTCYSSESDCNTETHYCSNRGSCRLKTSAGTTCYACFCEATVEDLPDGGRLTTKWAGPACQKKDVSMPFWLLGGASVGLVSVIAWAVALLYAMGQEELPSVIGAGVAGTRPGK